MAIPVYYDTVINQMCANLKRLLAENLYSCVLYGSTVRGNVIPGVSDINLLLVLQESTPAAHAAIADSLQSDIKIDPFILTRKGMERSFQVFALKFRSIKRHYKVLTGADPIADFSVSDDKVRFICEQGLRNLRLRSVHNFIRLRHEPKRYATYLKNLHTIIFTYVAEILRIEKQAVSDDFATRTTQIETFLQLDTSVLELLESMREKSHKITKADIESIHSQLFGFLNATVQWIERSWPMQS